MPDGLFVSEREPDEAFIVDLDGFEGPLDMLLALARTQKVDLREISVLKLAEQYLSFVETAQKLRLELAADYLVMAAWLAYLKSRLLLPPPDEEEGPSAEELAAYLAFQLERLEAMRDAAARLMARDQLGRDVFARGEEEAVITSRRTVWDATLLDLLRAYAQVKTKDSYTPFHVRRRKIHTVEDALRNLRRVLGASADWSILADFIPDGWRLEDARSAVASHFAATLEMAKRGEIELRQDAAFEPIYLRAAREGWNVA
jgi:segregation and condensation protein A